MNHFRGYFASHLYILWMHTLLGSEKGASTSAINLTLIFLEDINFFNTHLLLYPALRPTFNKFAVMTRDLEPTTTFLLKGVLFHKSDAFVSRGVYKTMSTHC